MLIISAVLVALALSYMIADTLCGPDINLIKTINTLPSFKLIVTPHEKRVLLLTIKISPVLLLLEATIYWLWLRDIVN